MDFLDRLAGRAAWPPASSLFKLTNLTPTVQKHLQKVYMTLALATAVSAVGCFVDIQYHIGGMVTFLCALASLMYLSITSPTASNLNARYGALAAFSFSQGASLGPLVDLAIAVNPAILLTAFMATAAVFGSFSLAALMTRRRTYLYLGGYLSAAISCLLLLRLSSWLFPGMKSLAFEAHLYLGLLIFSGYVLFDTQMIVERAGQKDHVRDALDLFVDLMALFVRILVIVLRNQARKDEEESRRRSSSKRR